MGRTLDKLPLVTNSIVLFCQVDVPFHAWSNGVSFKSLTRAMPGISQPSTAKRVWRSKKEEIWSPLDAESSTLVPTSAESRGPSRASGRITKLSARVAILDIQGRTGILGRGHLRGSTSNKMQVGHTVEDLVVEAVEGDRLWLSVAACSSDHACTMPLFNDSCSVSGDSLADVLDD